MGTSDHPFPRLLDASAQIPSPIPLPATPLLATAGLRRFGPAACSVLVGDRVAKQGPVLAAAGLLQLHVRLPHAMDYGVHPFQRHRLELAV